MSGGEPSSIKRFFGCAVGAPVRSRDHGQRGGRSFDLTVYGLIRHAITKKRVAQGGLTRCATHFL